MPASSRRQNGQMPLQSGTHSRHITAAQQRSIRASIADGCSRQMGHSGVLPVAMSSAAARRRRTAAADSAWAAAEESWAAEEAGCASAMRGERILGIPYCDVKEVRTAKGCQKA